MPSQAPSRFQGAQMQSPPHPLLTRQAGTSPPACVLTTCPASLRSHIGPVTLVIQVSTLRPKEGTGLTPGYTNRYDLRTPDSFSSALDPRLWAQWRQEPQHSCSLLGPQHPPQGLARSNFLSPLLLRGGVMCHPLSLSSPKSLAHSKPLMSSS